MKIHNATSDVVLTVQNALNCANQVKLPEQKNFPGKMNLLARNMPK